MNGLDDAEAESFGIEMHFSNARSRTGHADCVVIADLDANLAAGHVHGDITVAEADTVRDSGCDMRSHLSLPTTSPSASVHRTGPAFWLVVLAGHGQSLMFGSVAFHRYVCPSVHFVGNPVVW